MSESGPHGYIPVYIALGRWTQGWKGAGRLGETRAHMKSFGVENLATYFVVSGDYDTVTINRAKNLRSIVDCRLAMRMAGTITTWLFATLPVLENDLKLDPKMVTAVSLGRWTEVGARDPGARLTPAYLERIVKKEQGMGVQLNSVYRVVTGGHYDLISISQAKNLESLGACREALNAMGNIRTDTLCVVSEDEYRDRQEKLLNDMA